MAVSSSPSARRGSGLREARARRSPPSMPARTRLASRSASALAIPRAVIATVMAACQLPSAAWHASARTPEVCAVSSVTVATGQPSAQMLAWSSAAASVIQFATPSAAAAGAGQRAGAARSGGRRGRSLRLRAVLSAWGVLELRSPRGRAVCYQLLEGVLMGVGQFQRARGLSGRRTRSSRHSVRRERRSPAGGLEHRYDERETTVGRWRRLRSLRPRGRHRDQRRSSAE